MIQVFSIIVLVFSAIIHEYMHGWMADRLGDPTAKNAGRLTLNPLPHIDPIGSILLPGILILSGSPFVFGYAKPVPYNPNNLKDRKFGSAKVAFAGPLGNLIAAAVFGLLLRLFVSSGIISASSIAVQLMLTIVLINLFLMVFNLIPIPPLDGSKVLSAFLPYKGQIFMANLEQYGMIILIAVLFTGLIDFIYPLVLWLAQLFAGSFF